MKIIIVHASAGAGHLKAAQAIFDYLKQHCPAADIRIIDILDKSSFFFKVNYSKGYLFLVKHALFLWGLSFWITAFKPLRSLTRPIARALNRLNTQPFAQYLIEEQPDYIISTHFLPPEIAAYLKKKKKINSRLFTVITDFGVHPYWITDPVDIYLVASDFTKAELMREGIKENKIKVTGIPVDVKLLQAENKQLLCEKLNIRSDKFTVLVSTGSFGLGPIEEIVRLLHNDAELLVVCARNEKLRIKLLKLNYPGVKVFGFVDNMPELMSVSSLMITKPGGLSIAEILIRELVPLFICPIPGQEMENVRALEHYGAGISISSVSAIRDTVLRFKANPEELEKFKVKIRELKKPQVLEEICNVVCKNSIGPGC